MELNSALSDLTWSCFVDNIRNLLCKLSPCKSVYLCKSLRNSGLLGKSGPLRKNRLCKTHFCPLSHSCTVNLFRTIVNCCAMTFAQQNFEYNRRRYRFFTDFLTNFAVKSSWWVRYSALHGSRKVVGCNRMELNSALSDLTWSCFVDDIGNLLCKLSLRKSVYLCKSYCATVVYWAKVVHCAKIGCCGKMFYNAHRARIAVLQE